ncbi:MAG: hypothetical protein IPL61_25720 [Myxococcales bacterium]|nr:hypothetical protein [Myxococcales bacterium]
MKQVAFPKTSGTNVGEMRGVAERIAYQFSGTALGPLPIPPLSPRLRKIGRQMDSLARERASVRPGRKTVPVGSVTALKAAFEADAARYDSLQRQLVVLQEEIDWEIYTAAQLCPAGLLAADHSHHSLVLEGAEAHPGERPCHQGLPSSSALAMLWEKRRAAIAERPALGLMEQPLYKRPWLGVQGVFHRDGWTYAELLRAALREQMCGVLEAEVREFGRSPSVLDA